MWSPIFVTFSVLLAAFARNIHGSHPAFTARQDYSSPGTRRANFTLDELYKLQVRFWDNFVHNNTAQAASINSTLLAPDVLGRVDVTRTFDGQELNTEYLFGLFANLAGSVGNGSSTLLGVPVSYNIIHFAGNQDVTAAATVVFFRNDILGTFPIEIDTWNTWNEQGQVWQYDATFRWFSNLLDAAVAAAGRGSNDTSATVARLADALATGICTTAQQHCTTPETQQYASFDDCYATLMRVKRFGKAYELGGDTLLCRMVHENMVPLRPEVHCSHIGPSGGGMCVDDLLYAQRVLQEYFVHAPMVPGGYESGNKSVDAW